MTVRLKLPDAPCFASTYAEAKASGALLSLDALQKIYSPTYDPEKNLYLGLPRGIERYAATPIFLLARAVREHLPEIVPMVVKFFPNFKITGDDPSLEFLCTAISITSGEMTSGIILDLVPMEKEAREKIARRCRPLDLQKAAWKDLIGYFPTGGAESWDPSGLSKEVFLAVRKAGLAEGAGSARASNQAHQAAVLFDSIAEVARYYAAKMQVEPPEDKSLGQTVHEFFLKCSREVGGPSQAKNNQEQMRALGKAELLRLEGACAENRSRWRVRVEP